MPVDAHLLQHGQRHVIDDAGVCAHELQPLGGAVMPSPAVSACANVCAQPPGGEQALGFCSDIRERLTDAEQRCRAAQRPPERAQGQIACPMPTARPPHHVTRTRWMQPLCMTCTKGRNSFLSPFIILGTLHFLPAAADMHVLTVIERMQQVAQATGKRRPAARCYGWQPRLGRARGCLPAARTAGAAPRPG